MNKTAVFSAAAVAAGLVLTAAPAFADEWVDYTPMKGAYIKTMVHVEPSRMDDYLVALKKTWIPTEESLKRHGLIDTYQVQVNTNPYGPGPNVVMIEHWPALAGMEPDKVRDMAMRKEFEAILPKSEQAPTQEARGKYRTILSQEMWTVVDYSK